MSRTRLQVLKRLMYFSSGTADGCPGDNEVPAEDDSEDDADNEHVYVYSYVYGNTCASM